MESGLDRVNCQPTLHGTHVDASLQTGEVKLGVLRFVDGGTWGIHKHNNPRNAGEQPQDGLAGTG